MALCGREIFVVLGCTGAQQLRFVNRQLVRKFLFVNQCP